MPQQTNSVLLFPHFHFQGHRFRLPRRYLRTPALLPYLRSEKHPIPRQCLQPLPLKKFCWLTLSFARFTGIWSVFYWRLRARSRINFFLTGAINLGQEFPSGLFKISFRIRLRLFFVSVLLSLSVRLPLEMTSLRSELVPVKGKYARLIYPWHEKLIITHVIAIQVTLGQFSTIERSLPLRNEHGLSFRKDLKLLIKSLVLLP